MSSIDAIRRRRAPIIEPIATPPAPRPRSSSGGVLFGLIVLIGGFFLVTRPSSPAPTVSADKTTSTAPASAVSAPVTRTDLGPPQPDAGTSLEETVILDKPVASSQAQNGAEPTVITTSDDTGVAPDSFGVRILNGSGTSGVASKTQSSLKEKGFKVLSIGTAVNLYDHSIIYYQGDHEAAARAVRSALDLSKATLEENSVASPADVLVVIGKSD